MKSRTKTLFVLASIIIGCSAFATEKANDLQTAQESGPPPERKQPGERRGHGDHDMKIAIQRVMERLRTEDPEEFARLRALRQENPRAFKQELFSKLRARRETWAKGEGRPPRPMSDRSLEADERKKKAMKRSQEVRAAMQAYRKAGTPEEKSVAKEALRATLDERMTEHMKQREAYIARLRAQLDQLEKKNESDVKNKDEMVDKALAYLIEKAERGGPDRPKDAGKAEKLPRRPSQNTQTP